MFCALASIPVTKILIVAEDPVRFCVGCTFGKSVNYLGMRINVQTMRNLLFLMSKHLC